MRVRVPKFPYVSRDEPFTDYVPRLNREIEKGFDDVVRQLNGVSEGSASVFHNAVTAAPTTGVWFQGDYLRNATPSELGSAASKYVILGWVCTASGEPGTWLQCRVLTGN